MTNKQKAVQALQDLPEDASYEDAMERLLFLAKVVRASNRLIPARPLLMPR